MTGIRACFILLLAVFTGQAQSGDPTWDYSGLQSIATWRPQQSKVYLYRFTFTYKNKELQEIALIITRNEKPNQGGGQRSPVIPFQKTVKEGETFWTCDINWTGEENGKQVEFVKGALRTGCFKSPREDGDMYLSGDLTYQTGPHYYISDAKKIKGSLFAFHSKE